MINPQQFLASFFFHNISGVHFLVSILGVLFHSPNHFLNLRRPFLLSPGHLFNGLRPGADWGGLRTHFCRLPVKVKQTTN